MSKKFIWFSLLIMLTLGASAEVYYKQGTNISLKIPCTNDGTQCGASTNCNISVVTNLDGNYLVNNQQTENLGNGDFEYNISFNDYGQYTLKLYCTDGVQNATELFGAKVTESGIESSTAQGIIYVAAIFIVLILLILCLVGVFTIDGENPRDKDGSITNVNYNKHIKLLCGMLAYTFFWVFTFLAQEMAEYLNLGTLFSFFEILFILTSTLMIPIAMVIVFMIIYSGLNDSKINTKLKRGLRPR